MTKRKIEINHRKFEYTLKRRKGMRSMKLAIYQDGSFVVTAPRWYPLYVINKFLAERSQWIWEKLKNIDFVQLEATKKAEKNSYQDQKKNARKIIEAKVALLNGHYAFPVGRIAIRNQKTCWGSCSQKGNLNFNYKVAYLAEELQDYIIVHELCHLQELNHSPRFWKLVSEMVPDYRVLRRKLKQIK